MAERPKHAGAFMFVNQPEDRFRAQSHVQSRRRLREKQQQKGHRRGHDHDHAPPAPPAAAQSSSMSLIRPTDDYTDPFHCTAAGKDARVTFSVFEVLLDVDMETTIAESFGSRRSVVTAAVRKRLRQPMSSRLKSSITDPMMMYSSLALATTYVGWMRAVQLGAPLEFYVDKALHEVRGRLHLAHDSVSRGHLMMAIHALAVTQLWSGIPELWAGLPNRAPSADPHCLDACRTHLHAIRRLVVASPDGWSDFDAFLLKGCLLTDKYLALYESRPGILPITWDPPPPTQAVHPSSRFFSHDLDEGLLSLISAALEYVAEATSRWSSISDDDPDFGFPRLFLRLQSLQFRLLALQTEGLSEVVRLSAILLLLEGSEYRGAQVAAKMRVDELLDAILGLEYTESDDLIFWCACVGLMASDLESQKDLCSTIILDSTNDLGIRITFEEFRAVLRRYVYLDEKQDAPLKELVNHVKSVKYVE